MMRHGQLAGWWRIGHALLGRLAGDSLFRNSFYIMGTTIVNSFFGYLFWVLAARTHSASDVGLAASLIAMMTIASLVSCEGIASTLIQTLPGRQEGRPWSTTFHACLAAGTLTSLGVSAIAILVAPLFSGRLAALLQHPAYVLAFLAAVPLWTLTMLLDATFIAERSAGKMLARNAAGAALKNIALYAFLPLAWAGALSIFGASLLGSAGGIVAGIILVSRLGRRYQPVLRGVAGQIPAIARTAVGHHLINLGAIAPTYLLPLVVTARLSAANTAYLYTTWMTAGVFLMISPAVGSSLFAEGSAAAESMRERTRASVRIIAALLAPIIVVFLLGGHLILTVFGAAYARHGLALLYILAISSVPDAITNLYVTTLRVRRRLRQAAWLNLGMAALALVLAWLLLPPLGIAGAGWAWLIAQSAGSVVVGVDLLRARVAHRAGSVRRQPDWTTGALPAESPTCAPATMPGYATAGGWVEETVSAGPGGVVALPMPGQRTEQ